VGIGSETMGKNATYLYVESIIAMVAGYVLWLFLSSLSSPDVIGIASTVVSLSVIFSQIVDIHVSVGGVRFLGKSFAEGNLEDVKLLVTACLIIVLLGILAGSVFITTFKQWLFPAIPIDLIIILILLIGVTIVVNLLRAVLVSALKTSFLPIITIISSAFRIVLAVTLLHVGFDALGITIGYLSGFCVALVLLSVKVFTNLSGVKMQATINLYLACKRILVASIPSWIPTVLLVVGSHLGTVVVFATAGAGQAASYFIATAIFYAIDAIRNSLFSVGFPILSAMDDGRKKFLWRIIKMSMVISLPVTFAVMPYTTEILGLIGPNYAQGSMSLKIILLSVFPLTFLYGISTLIYSYGNYRQVLAIGVGTNLPRVLLYFILVPIFGSPGAALSFTVGSIIGFAISIMAAKRIGMKIYWRELALLVGIPIGLTFPLTYLQVTPIIGIPIVLTLSPIMMFALRVISKSEVRQFLGILPEKIRTPLINILNRL
jgi:O-antigen/teichoic acid export membrane protein